MKVESYDIKYDDGDSEQNADPENVRVRAIDGDDDGDQEMRTDATYA